MGDAGWCHTVTLVTTDVRGLLDPAVLPDPHSVYREWRQQAPVRWDPCIEAWVVTGYRECVSVLQNTDDYCSDWRRIGEETPAAMLSIQTLDPPDHTGIRHMMLNAMREHGVRAVDELAATAVGRQLESHRREPVIDFVADFAEPVALEVVTGLLGVPTPELDWFVPVSHAIVDAMDAGLRPECFEQGINARAELAALAGSWLSAPADSGLVSQLMSAGAIEGIDRGILLNTLRATLHAGFESVSRFLSGALFAILQLPRAQRVDLTDDRALNEMVRYVSPVQADSRGCVGDSVLGDQPMRRGEIVTLLLGAANRVPRTFEAPDDLILTRTPNHHLGFGRGAHACIGATIALSLARATFAAIQDQHPDIRIVAEPTHRPNATLRGLDCLPVALTTPESAIETSQLPPRKR